MDSQKVTVAIPVYNGMPHIKQAVESVLTQTHENLELVIIDDGSSDGTTDYLQTIDDPRVVLSPNPQNLGVEGAWNRALDQAERSDFFKIVCADDYLLPNCIATELSAMDAYPNVVMTAHPRRIVDDNGNTLMKARGLAGMAGVVRGIKAVKKSIGRGTNVLGEPSSILLRSSAVKDLRFRATNKLLIDFDLWARALKKGDLFAIREPLSAFRVGVLSDSLKTMKTHRKMQVDEFKLLASDPELQITKPTLLRGTVNAAVVAYGRRVFYVLLNIREKFKK